MNDSKYSKYKVEDFATDESFVNWVNNADPESERFWSLVRLKYPEVVDEIEQARILIMNLKRAEETRNDSSQIELIWESINDSISPASIPESSVFSKFSVKKTFAFYGVRLLAVLIAILGLGWFFKDEFVSPQSSNDVYTLVTSGFKEKVNESGIPVNISLGDGSIVTLESKSRIKYKENYASEKLREVYLQGTAFFEIAKDASKPFIVHTHEVNTEVLGTSFRVQSSENDQQVVVSVKTGKVSVYSANDKESITDRRHGVILLPNQEVSYERRNNSFSKSIVKEPALILPQEVPHNFIFDNTPIKDVFKTLEHAYGIEIIYNEEIMKNCYLTAPLGSESLFEKLTIICQTIGGNYEVIDTKIVITGTGC